jgi:hypothetical protein
MSLASPIRCEAAELHVGRSLLATALRSASRLVRGHPSLRHRKRLGQAEGISRGLPGCRCETSGVGRIDSASRPQHPCVLACPPCTCERHHRRYATTDSQGARSRPQRPMPLWLWQEVQALPWSTEIVALTCGTQNCLRPPSSLLKRPQQACCATPVQDQKCWNTAAFEQSQFIDHTGKHMLALSFSGFDPTRHRGKTNRRIGCTTLRRH